MSSLPSTPSVAGAVEALRARAPETATGRFRMSWIAACLAVDGLMLVAAVAATWLGSRGSDVPVMSLAWLASFGVLIVVLSWWRGMYEPRLRLELLEDVRALVAITSLAAMAILSMRVLFTHVAVDAAEVLRPWAFATAYIAAGRAALSWSRIAARRDGESLKPTLIVGAGRIGRLTARRLLDHPELGLRPIGFLDKDPLDDVNGDGDLPVLGASWDLERVLLEHEVEHVIVTFSTAPNEVLLRIAKNAEEAGASVAFVPRLFEHVTRRMSIDYLGGLPIISVRRLNSKGLQFTIKYALDRLLAPIAIVLALPFLVVCAVAVWVSLGRPVIFRQARVGRDGRRFEMLKFRTMHSLTPEEAAGRLEEVADDERLTAVGRFLRAASLDELPQLFNVLKGEMSLVGPRPEQPEFVALFENTIHRYSDRHRVKSGITGWAQVHGLGRGSDRFVNGSQSDRVEWDNYYIENWSLWLDFKIVVSTILAVLSFKQSH
jgi:exopolysaccharide biosynthesis polyprenyl glycosylphosphotransferase